MPRMLAGVDAALMKPPVNVMRVALHPSGLAPRTINLAEWRAHLLDRLRRQAEASADPVLLALLEELRGYPGAAWDAAGAGDTGLWRHGRAVRTGDGGGTMTFLSTTTVFGTPVDITLSEIGAGMLLPGG